MFLKKKQEQTASRPVMTTEDEQSKKTDNTANIKKHIHALLAYDFINMPTSDDEVSALLKQLTKQLQKHVMSEMDHCVELSIEVNEAAIFSARMLSDLKEVDHQTQNIASAAEEMVATVNEIENYGFRISEQAQEAHRATGSGAEAVMNASESMRNITRAVSQGVEQVNILAQFTEKIADIAEDIKKIAEQTNLLALNATIEAARAGEAGKGFAVVAGEVKSLSQETAKSTEAISDIIVNIQTEMSNVLGSMDNSKQAVDDGQNAITQVNERMNEINEKINVVTDNTAQISNTLKEQNIAANEVAKGIATIAQSSSESVSGVEHIVDSMDKVENILGEQIQTLSEFNVPDKVIKLAQSDHVIWKKRLAGMVAGRGGLNASELADHHSCRLGKWYDKVTDPQYLNNPKFKQLSEPHRTVHQKGIEAVKLYNQGNVKEALNKIEEVEQASKDVLLYLSQLEGSAK